MDELDLPRSGYGVDGDALWVDPRFLEAETLSRCRCRADGHRRFNVELHRPVRTPEEVKLEKRKARKARGAPAAKHCAPPPLSLAPV